MGCSPPLLPLPILALPPRPHLLAGAGAADDHAGAAAGQLRQLLGHGLVGCGGERAGRGGGGGGRLQSVQGTDLEKGPPLIMKSEQLLEPPLSLPSPALTQDEGEGGAVHCQLAYRQHVAVRVRLLPKIRETCEPDATIAESE